MTRDSVLIIEDDPTLLRGLKDNFESKGYRVSTASDGERGLGAALDEKPDLIVLDGDPAADITNLGRTKMVYQAGARFSPEELRDSVVGTIE